MRPTLRFPLVPFALRAAKARGAIAADAHARVAARPIGTADTKHETSRRDENRGVLAHENIEETESSLVTNDVGQTQGPAPRDGMPVAWKRQECVSGRLQGTP